ncbi:MAG TPA: hypothetical protein VFB41_01885 [Solirubrobacteraceae bacterium]|nr:hypothetical protein [Solirubrobacteraceae bacterium]
MRRIVFAVIAAACFALPALASGENQAGEVDTITCGDGTTLTPPFSAPVCGGRGGIESVTCLSGDVLTPPLDDQRCPADDQSDDPSQGQSDDPLQDDSGDEAEDTVAQTKPRHFVKPHFKAAFLNRVWRISGEANGYDAGVLDFTAASFKQLPRRWAHQDDSVVGEDTRVLVGSKTRVYDAARHRVAAADVATALDEAADVVVTTKVLPLAKWQKDEDGIPVPTLRAKRVTIVD